MNFRFFAPDEEELKANYEPGPDKIKHSEVETLTGALTANSRN